MCVKKKSTLLIKETKVFLQHLHLHNTKNQKALDWQVFHTLDDVVAIHINISMQLPAQTLKFEGKLFTHLNSAPQELINSQ